ncbi:diguanylate cyclase [Craterilacuibacter sp. RT1T]|uniref:GGDEF domain-containing protein n=1 Tax=Craterilacuibacter sp. RT1T TaxID=2942211 RepID=UPI0020BD796A|nr:diguanylate cyclase [Craterilacuibacter sp. RT1T]MCL6261911.1 diguanylate cyclase [Craterilacuibacter sp. RT1T]
MLADERAFQALIDTVQGALVLVTPADGKIFAANQLAAILLGIPRTDLIGQPFFGHLADPADEASLITRLAQQGMLYNEEVMLKAKGGHQFNAQLSLREVDFLRPVLAISFSDRSETVMMGRLLESERQVCERVLKLAKELKHEPRITDADDYLSGVLGMPALLSGLAHEVGRANRYGHSLSALLISIEGIPNFNHELDKDTAGYIRRMTGSLCMQSARDCDLIARREDGCLLLVLPYTPMQGATRAARRLIASLSLQQFQVAGENRSAAACVGLSSLRKGESSHKHLLARLDLALTRSRAQGINTLARQP